MWDKVIYIVLSVAMLYYFRNRVLKIVKYLNFQYKFWLFFLWTSFLNTVTLPLFALRPKDVRNAVIIANGMKQVTRIIGIKWNLRNGDILAEDRGAVIVANHQSAIDILGMSYIWQVIGRCAIVSKKEMMYMFTAGLSMYLIGSIFIDRKDPKNAFKELETKADVKLKNKVLPGANSKEVIDRSLVGKIRTKVETKIWIFPEGTRNRDLTKLLPFKKGAFAVAVSSQVPVIPVVFSPYYFINSKNQIFNKGDVIVQCLEPVPTVGLTMDDLPDLMQRVHAIMERTYKELLHEAMSTLPPNYPIAIQE